MVVASHLYDAQQEVYYLPALAADRIKFVQYLTMNYKFEDQLSDEKLDSLWSYATNL